MKNTDSGIIGTKIVLSSIKTNDIHHLCDFFSKPYIVATEGLLPYQPTPEDIVCQRETLVLLLSILDTCTAIQRERFLLYALYGFSYTEIGMMQGCSRESVYESIQAVRRKFLKFFSNHPDNGLF